MKSSSKIAIGCTAGLLSLAALGYGVIGCAIDSLHTSIPKPTRSVETVRIRAYPASDQRKGVEACERHGMAIEAETYEPGYPIYGRIARKRLEELRSDPDIKRVDELEQAVPVGHVPCRCGPICGNAPGGRGICQVQCGCFH